MRMNRAIDWGLGALAALVFVCIHAVLQHAVYLLALRAAAERYLGTQLPRPGDGWLGWPVRRWYEFVLSDGPNVLLLYSAFTQAAAGLSAGDWLLSPLMIRPVIGNLWGWLALVGIAGAGLWLPCVIGKPRGEGRVCQEGRNGIEGRLGRWRKLAVVMTVTVAWMMVLCTVAWVLSLPRQVIEATALDRTEIPTDYSLLVLAGSVITASWCAWRGRAARPAGARCTRCGYGLEGLIVCPECGPQTLWPKSWVARMIPRDVQGELRRGLIAIGICGLGAMMVSMWSVGWPISPRDFLPKDHVLERRLKDLVFHGTINRRTILFTRQYTVCLRFDEKWYILTHRYASPPAGPADGTAESWGGPRSIMMALELAPYRDGASPALAVARWALQFDRIPKESAVAALTRAMALELASRVDAPVDVVEAAFSTQLWAELLVDPSSYFNGYLRRAPDDALSLILKDDPIFLALYDTLTSGSAPQKWLQAELMRHVNLEDSADLPRPIRSLWDRASGAGDALDVALRAAGWSKP